MSPGASPFARPAPEFLARQSEALAPLRSRLLRGVQVATRGTILDLGAGAGSITAELVRRGGGEVLAVDAAPDFLDLPAEPFAGARRIRASSDDLPLPDGSVDLVVCQLALLWMPLASTLDEIARILGPAGALVAIEPDLGGLIEWPEDRAVRPVWLRALAAAGADPRVGRKLPGLLQERGFDVRVELVPQVTPPGPARLAPLAGLPLTDDERAHVARLRATEGDGWETFAWAPVFGITARRRT